MSENKTRFFDDVQLPDNTLRLFISKEVLFSYNNENFDVSRYQNAVIDLIDAVLKFTVIVNGDTLRVSTYFRVEGCENGLLHHEQVIDVHDDLSGEESANSPAKIALRALRIACDHIAENDLADQLEQYSNELSGMLITSQDDGLQSELVFGSDRPALLCSNEKGEVYKCRPYFDEKLLDVFGGLHYGEAEDMDLDELLEAADEEDEEALDRLYLVYLNGDEELEVEADVNEAVKWLKKYVETGNSIALFNMGLHYMKGYGVERDYQKAYEMMKAAAERGDADAANWMSKLQDLPEKIAAAQEGDAQATADYARFLMEAARSLEQAGFGKDMEDAFRYAEKAAAQNNGDGLWLLGLAYEHGRGVSANMEEAFQCYRKGAEAGHASCQSSLAAMYMNGAPIPRDMKRGFEWTLKSALQGNTVAMYNLGRCYQFGHGTEQSMPKAIEWYDKYLEKQPNEELERKVAIFKNLETQKENASAENSQLPEGYMDALEKTTHDFKIESDTLVKYQGNDEKVNTPMNLKAIGPRAFVLRDNLKEIEITPNVQVIGERAFLGCHQLQKVTFPQTLQEIHDFGFANCDRLEAVDLPQGMTAIGECAFINCSSIKSIVIPDGITEIQANAFQNCGSLERVVLPAGLKRIGQEAFAECAMLKEINLPDGLTQTGRDAFRGCSQLASLPGSGEQTTDDTLKDPAAFFEMLQQMQEQEDSDETFDFSSVREARKNLFHNIEFLNMMNSNSDDIPGQDRNGTTLIIEKAEYDQEKRLFTLITGVNNIRGEAITLTENLRTGQKLKLTLDGNDGTIANASGVYLGDVHSMFNMPLSYLLKNDGAELLDASVSMMKTRAQRGPRTRVPVLAVQLTVRLKETQNAGCKPHATGCTLCCMGGDQLKIWAQKLTVMHCTVPLENAKLVFELYNRMHNEYSADPEEAPGYAGLDNLDREIMQARKMMRKQMKPGMDYDPCMPQGDDEMEFSVYMARMIANEPTRYGALREILSGGCNTPVDILSRYADETAVYFWSDLTRIPEETFDKLYDGYSHWYDVCELYGPGELPFDLKDEDLLSIFGFGRFEAFADLSYGC